MTVDTLRILGQCNATNTSYAHKRNPQDASASDTSRPRSLHRSSLRLRSKPHARLVTIVKLVGASRRLPEHLS